MALFESRAEEVERIDGARMSLVIYRVGRSTLVTRASGQAEIAHIERLIRRSDDLIARMGVIDVVHDWFGITGYSAEIRPRMTPWARKTRAQHRGIHIGTESALVRMGVTMVALFSAAPLHAYDSLQSLEKALTEILATQQ